ncbi:MAG TPA: 3-phosphoshikimate 1-carboxyvinyltransferase [Buchnera sp. (in: enterobacteria)]|nr:3-phosphoshikimate 1-carboxyvinyltransferase [Buchnera sp. (in: enterobacteria)]
MTNSLTLNTISYINGNVNLPGSKSISNRVLLLSAVSNGTTILKNLLYSDDTKYMLYALKTLGIKYILTDNNTTCKIYGQGQSFNCKKPLSLFLGNAGTAMRPLVAMLSLNNNDILLTGENRMKERPIHDLIDALRQGGACIKYCENIHYPPINVKGGFIGGKITINGNVSSQFLTALLMAAPLAKLNTTICLEKSLVSKPYIDITLKLMQSFGIQVINNSYQYFYIIGNQKYISPGQFYIEGDASSASYFLAASAIKGGSVCVSGIGTDSIQGDINFATVLQNMGANIYWGKNFIACSKGKLKAIDLDMNDIPDAAMTVAIVALFATGTTVIRNIYNWRLKETDRLSAMSIELKKIGAKVNEGEDFISITPPDKFCFANIETYNDHRMAMCFSLIALSDCSVNILNPQCTKKTFPDYFHVFSSISFFN